jgi:hypothetical protein
MTTKEWKPNEVQSKFMDTLKGEDNALTLEEISTKAGIDFKSGSINALVAKGLITHGEDKEITVSVKRKVKTYKLATKD